MALIFGRLMASWVIGCAAQPSSLPGAKRVINGLGLDIRGHVQWNNWPAWSKVMDDFFDANFTYDFVYPLGKTHGVRDWYLGEHMHYNHAFPKFKSTNFLFLAEGDNLSSLQSYHTVHWNGTFAGVPAPPHKPLIKIKDLDFYILKGDMIVYNWCMIDVVAILQQGGYNVLPPSALPGGIEYLPPRAMDGIPSPDSMFAKASDAKVARVAFRSMLEEDFLTPNFLARWWFDDMMWCGPAGIGDANTRSAYVEGFLKPLHSAFTGLRIHMDSHDCEGNYCGAHFHLVGKHVGTWLGQPATNRQIALRFGLHARFVIDAYVDGCGQCGRIADAWTQLDIPDAFAQMGVDLLSRAKVQSQREASFQQDFAFLQRAPLEQMQSEIVKASKGGCVSLVILAACSAFVSVFVAVRLWRGRACGQGLEHSLLE